ncbi:ATP-dependent RNA helicase dbp10, partial [Coemansia nantahalensis]
EWQDKTKIYIPRPGEDELANAGRRSQAGKFATGRFRHTAVSETKPLDPMAIDYERKLKKRKLKEDKAAGSSDAYKGTVEFSDSEAAGAKRPGKGSGSGKKAKKAGGQDRQPARSELKSRDQIRKDRISKERLVDRHGRGGKAGGSRGGRSGGGSRGGRTPRRPNL